ncbi:MAG: hypothetical protein U0359_11110 [Byssovorax sp.]
MTTGMKFGLAAGAVLAAIFIVRLVFSVRTMQAEAEANTQKAIDHARENTQRIDRQLEAAKTALEAQRKRIASATFRASRLNNLDGQCLGKGKPQYGYLIEGSTYADNVIVGNAASCEAFGPAGVDNITNFFCCHQDNLPPVLQLNVTITGQGATTK